MISQTGQTEAISGTAVVTTEIYNKSIINTFGQITCIIVCERLSGTQSMNNTGQKVV